MCHTSGLINGMEPRGVLKVPIQLFDEHAIVALGMSRNWSKKGYRPSYQHASEDLTEKAAGGGDGETKPDANPKTTIDLSDEPEARRRRV
ncbi:hypothetical protein L1987_58017 [Smallanthus sonchifolius]|uniref:Uncharacterized protein n=1 Tax=Smallanthus sonchifolius TaxID=185202 RepID=A0ACB9DE55_9ASTR|nr:hypothetical protein L1987_58017 [Smallanthus sonchifolius]